MLYLKNKTHTITVRLSDNEFRRLKRYSIMQFMSMSEIIRQLIRNFTCEL